MKRIYIAPAVEVITITPEPMMLILSVENPDLVVDGDVEIDTRDEQLANQRRGTWGNLWADPEG